MTLAVGIEEVGVGTLVAVLVALFGIAVKFFTQAAGTATERFEAEIERLRVDKRDQIEALRVDKDDQIEALRAERDAARSERDRLVKQANDERDVWFKRYMEERRS